MVRNKSVAHSVAPRRDPTTEWCFMRCVVLKMSRVGSRLAETYQAIVFSFCKVSDLACHHTHRYVITTEHLRSSLSNLLIFLTLSLSEAEREVYHNRTVSDGL